MDICNKLENIIGAGYSKLDFLQAVRTIFSATKPDSIARAPMARECTVCLEELRSRKDFVALLRDLPDLGLEIIRHPDLECAFPGDWLCEFSSDCRGLPSCPRVVELCDYAQFTCGKPFEKSFSWKHRHEEKWPCPSCKRRIEPVCTKCRARIKWSSRGLDDEPSVFDDGYPLY